MYVQLQKTLTLFYTISSFNIQIRYFLKLTLSIHTIPLLRERLDSYHDYIRYRTYEITPSQTQFQVIFNSVENVNTGIHYRKIYPQNKQPTIQDVFNKYMNELLDFNEN